jgi:hypothetical protein
MPLAVLVVLGLAACSGSDRPSVPDVPVPPAAAGDGLRWVLEPAGSDEFDGSGPVDPGRWDTTRAERGFAAGGAPFNPRLEQAFYRPENARRVDGALVLSVRAERPTTVQGVPYTLSSGMVHSGRHHRLVRQPGVPVYLEARIFVPAGAHGLWPAFWLVNAAHDDEPYRVENQAPELDVVEFWADGRTADSQRPWSNLHRLEGGLVVHEDERAYGTAALGAWHTYAVYLDDERVVPSFDGTPQPDAGRTVPLPAGQPMDVVLNLAVARCLGHGRECAVPELGGAAGRSVRVDHVREYHLTAG